MFLEFDHQKAQLFYILLLLIELMCSFALNDSKLQRKLPCRAIKDLSSLRSHSLSLSELGLSTASRCCWNISVPLWTTPERKTVTEPSSVLMYVSVYFWYLHIVCLGIQLMCQSWATYKCWNSKISHVDPYILSWSHKMKLLNEFKDFEIKDV